MDNTNLKNRLEEMIVKDFPAGLHQKIMFRVQWARFQRFSSTVIFLLALNFVWSGWRLWAKILEAEFITTAKAIFSGLILDYDVIVSALTTALELAPWRAVFDFTLSLVLVSYFIYYYHKESKLWSAVSE